MPRYFSKDGLWRVSVPAPGGHPVIRVEVHSPVGWMHRGDFRTPAEIERFVPLSELTEEEPHHV